MRSLSKIKLITVGLLFFSLFLQAQNPDALFKSANEHYANARFAEAVDDYTKIIDQGLVSAELYYNLGNAHFKLNNVAETVYFFEKAKQLDPADADIRNNAVFAENMKIDAIEELPQNAVKKWTNSILELLTFDGWAITSIIAIILFVFLFLGYYFTYDTTRKRLFFVTFSLSLLIALICLGFAYSAFAKATTDNPAIVFASEIEIKSEPNLASASVFTLHQGTKVMVLETIGDWRRIQLADGQVGWILGSDLKLLNDY